MAHLGVEVLPSIDREVETTGPRKFVVLGTIEPRKNHQLLLDVWDDLARTGALEPLPELHIIGKRGWMNEDVFKRLDKGQSGVFEHGSLDDGELAKFLAKSDALLFPSLAEGYGLPALEAASAGLPVICSDIDVFQELLADIALFVPEPTVAAWKNTIAEFCTSKIPPERDNVARIPRWNSHFRHVFG